MGEVIISTICLGKNNYSSMSWHKRWWSYLFGVKRCGWNLDYSDVIMSAMASQITGVLVVYSTVYWTVNSPHKGPQRGKCFHLMTLSCQISNFQTHTGNNVWMSRYGRSEVSVLLINFRERCVSQFRGIISRYLVVITRYNYEMRGQ